MNSKTEEYRMAYIFKKHFNRKMNKLEIENFRALMNSEAFSKIVSGIDYNNKCRIAINTYSAM